MREDERRQTPMEVLTPIKPGWMGASRLVSWWNQTFPKVFLRSLPKLSFIHFAWWGFLTDIPYNGLPQRRESLRYTYLLFESNFNGGWDDYIDTFSYIIPVPMWLAWGSSFGFPGPRPVSRFKAYIEKNQFPVVHYYSAYPKSSTTMVVFSLRAHGAVRAFNAETTGFDPVQFGAAYRRLVRSLQRSPQPQLVSSAPVGPFVTLAPIVAGHEPALRRRLESYDAAAASPMAAVPGTHFARWLIIPELVWEGPPQRPDPLKSQYLLFSAYHDKPAESWLNGLAKGLGPEADEIWGHCAGYSPGSLKYYLLHNQLRDTALFYAGYSATVEQVRESLRWQERLQQFIVDHQSADDATIQKDWVERFREEESP
jgi:hypothetical protein